MSSEVPATVELESVADFSATVDVLVVGLGIAGGSAAVEAAEAGASVLVLDRGGPGGSTTALAGGHFYLGGGTPVQTATGHTDSPEEMYKYLEAVSPEPDPEKLRLYCAGSVEHFEWLEGLGFEFERSYYPGKAVIQPGTEGLMYTGNEKVWPFREIATPAPRGHKVPVPGDTGGARLVVELLEQRATALGARVEYDTGATALVIDAGGRVCGVRWKRFGETGFVRAGAVVLAAGGFTLNTDMLAKYAPRLHENVLPQGNSNDLGLGVRLGMSVGGAVRNMSGAFLSAPFYPPAELLNGILVNRHGERFVAEDSYHGRTGAAIMEQPDSVAYLVVDEHSVRTPYYGTAALIDGWETVSEMESALAIPEGKLATTLARYNEHAARGEDPEWHKHREWLRSLDTGPWAAFDLSVGKAMFVGFPLGGLCTSADGVVLDEAGAPVPGLYAAGASASNIAQDSSGYASGTRLGEGSFFGRRAGRHAAGADAS